ncbi:MAG: DUF2948 family protein [Cypionkella sp.]
MSDARFEDAADAPLRLIAQDADSLLVLSALLQDAVFLASDMAYDRVEAALCGLAEPVSLGRCAKGRAGRA